MADSSSSSSATVMAEDAPQSAYEEIRLNNIKRNAVFLENIGISTTERRGPRDGSVKKRKAGGPAAAAAAAAAPVVEPTRRSSRVAQLDPVDYTDVSIVILAVVLGVLA
jgi:hypothetical protein